MKSFSMAENCVLNVCKVLCTNAQYILFYKIVMGVFVNNDEYEDELRNSLLIVYFCRLPTQLNINLMIILNFV